MERLQVKLLSLPPAFVEGNPVLISCWEEIMKWIKPAANSQPRQKMLKIDFWLIIIITWLYPSWWINYSWKTFGNLCCCVITLPVGYMTREFVRCFVSRNILLRRTDGHYLMSWLQLVKRKFHFKFSKFYNLF